MATRAVGGAAAHAVTCRRARAEDVADVRAILASSGCAATFGNVHAAHAIELNVASYVALDAAGAIVGCARASDRVADADTDAVVQAVQDVVSDAVVSVRARRSRRRE
jgi:hypothetical protein